MSFVRREVALLGLGLVLGRAALIGTLMLSTCPKSSAGAVASRELIAINSHIGANPLDLGTAAATVDIDGHPTRGAFPEVALLHATMAALQGLLTDATAERDRIRAGSSSPTLEQHIHGFGSTWASRHQARHRWALTRLIIQQMTLLGAFVVTTGEHPIEMDKYEFEIVVESVALRSTYMPN